MEGGGDALALPEGRREPGSIPGVEMERGGGVQALSATALPEERRELGSVPPTV